MAKYIELSAQAEIDLSELFSCRNPTEDKKTREENGKEEDE